MAGLDCAEVSPAAWPSLGHVIASTVTISDTVADTAMRELAANGLTIGESGAAPLAGLRTLQNDKDCRGLREHLATNRQTRVLLIATEARPARRGTTGFG